MGSNQYLFSLHLFIISIHLKVVTLLSNQVTNPAIGFSLAPQFSVVGLYERKRVCRSLSLQNDVDLIDQQVHNGDRNFESIEYIIHWR